MAKTTSKRRPKARAEGLLTDKFIESAPLGLHRDGKEPGYILRVGRYTRTLEVRFELRGKQRDSDWPTTVQLGHWPDISAAAAREKAQALIRRFRAGKPYQTIEPDGPKRLTVDEAMDLYVDWLDRRAKTGKARTLEWARSIKKLSPAFRAKTLHAISEDASLYRPEHDRLVKERGEETAKVVRAALNACYRRMAEDHETTLPKDLPTRIIPRPKAEPEDELMISKKRPALMPEEVPLWNEKRLALRNPITREFWLFAYLSGLRRGNLGGDIPNERPALRWDMWDRTTNVMTMIQKGNKYLRLVLSQPMIDCLERARAAGMELYPRNAKEWCFPNRGETGRHTGKEQDISMHLAIAGEERNVSSHILRRTYASLNGLPLEVNNKLLGHSKKIAVMSHYAIDAAQLKFDRMLQEQSSAQLISLLGPLGVTGDGEGSSVAAKDRRGKSVERKDTGGATQERRRSARSRSLAGAS